jgi:uncharacterized OsmC-like protein
VIVFAFNTIKRLHKALLIFHSPLDEIVDIENAAQIYQAAKHPKSFISLDKADHLLSDPHDSTYVGKVISAWARKYIEPLDQVKQTTLVEEGDVRVQTGADSYTTQVQAGSHYMIVDEPESLGGNDLGPNPYDYLLTALGACTSITLRMYANRKKWPVENIKVYLTHDKIHADSCEECETEHGYVDKITREIELEGELNDQQRQRLVEIADRCPVHRTLHSEIIVNTELKK